MDGNGHATAGDDRTAGKAQVLQLLSQACSCKAWISATLAEPRAEIPPRTWPDADISRESYLDLHVILVLAPVEADHQWTGHITLSLSPPIGDHSVTLKTTRLW